jgi:hypothetical protein
MSSVQYQSYRPSGPDPETNVKTYGENATGKTQAVALDDSAGMPLVVTGANTGVRGLRVYGGPTDPISDIPVYMDFDHHQIHEGEAWHCDVYIANLNSAANRDIVFTVPNLTITNAIIQCPHFRYEVSVNDLCNVFFYEAPTVTAETGTPLTAVNFERNGTYTAGVTILDAPTITNVGTQIDAEYFMTASTTQSKISNSGNSPHEFVLKNNTKYLFRVTSGAAGCDIHVDFTWYEDMGV